MPLFSTFGAASLNGFTPASSEPAFVMELMIIAGGGGGESEGPLGEAKGG